MKNTKDMHGLTVVNNHSSQPSAKYWPYPLISTYASTISIFNCYVKHSKILYKITKMTLEDILCTVMHD